MEEKTKKMEDIKINIKGYGDVTKENLFSILCEPLALKLIKTEDGVKLLAKTESPAGIPALRIAAFNWNSVMLELEKTGVGKQYLYGAGILHREFSKLK